MKIQFVDDNGKKLGEAKAELGTVGGHDGKPLRPAILLPKGDAQTLTVQGMEFRVSSVLGMVTNAGLKNLTGHKPASKTPSATPVISIKPGEAGYAEAIAKFNAKVTPATKA